jgi:hypothetical protein
MKFSLYFCQYTRSNGGYSRVQLVYSSLFEVLASIYSDIDNASNQILHGEWVLLLVFKRKDKPKLSSSF